MRKYTLIPVDGGGLRSVAVNPNGRQMVAIGATNSPRVYETASAPAPRFHIVGDIQFAFAERSFEAAVARGRGLEIHDLRSGEIAATLNSAPATIEFLAMAADGSRIAAACKNGQMAIWDREGAVKCVVETGEGGAVRSLAMTRDGRTLATLQGDSAVRLWDSKSGAELAQLKIGDARVSCLEFTPDGAAVVTSQFGSLRVWNARTGAPIRDIQAQPWTIQCLAFSSDGNKLLAGGGGDMFKLWDVAEDWRASPMVNVPRGFEAAAISPDGMTFATGARDGVVRLWSIDLGEELGQLVSLHGPIHRLAFSADGDSLVTGGDSLVRGREILVWLAEERGQQTTPEADFARCSTGDGSRGTP
ncbi:MAG TPA: hypothetical protein VGX78_21030 [Pirellulales bacterium]|nr:hypothetical protein [Pirellulales bacterium]